MLQDIHHGATTRVNNAPDTSIVYETRYETDAEHAAAFDTWLRDHVADMLQCPGFLSAEILDAGLETTSAPVMRTVHYRIRDRAAWDVFVAEHAARLGETLDTALTGRARVERRVLAAREQYQHGAVSTENCLNCGEVLRGQHCEHCGQRARVRVLSLWALLRDVLGDVLNWDARLWRTLRPLAFRPGYLTQEYLRGRRTRYTPPFRMYLILSVLFFVVASLGDGIRFQAGVGTGVGEESGNAAPALDAERQEIADTIVARVPETEQPRVRTELQARLAELDPAEVEKLRVAAEDPCGTDSLRISAGAWLEPYEPRLLDACRKITDDAQGFSREVYANVPRTMFVFLPLVALLMQLLYAGSGRFYVEHLLFFVHCHAYFFLGWMGVVLLGYAADAAADTSAGGSLDAVENGAITAFSLWSFAYLYLAMRRVYGQSRVLTLAKYVLLLLGYAMGTLVTALGLMLYTALTL